MAEFQEVMRQWNRMCNVIDKTKYICSDAENGYICPMRDNGLCCKSISAQTDEDRANGEKIIMSWAAEHPEPVYPTWGEWLQSMGVAVLGSGMLSIHPAIAEQPIPAELAEKLEIEPKPQV